MKVHKLVAKKGHEARSIQQVAGTQLDHNRCRGVPIKVCPFLFGGNSEHHTTTPSVAFQQGIVVKCSFHGMCQIETDEPLLVKLTEPLVPLFFIPDFIDPFSLLMKFGFLGMAADVELDRIFHEAGIKFETVRGSWLCELHGLAGIMYRFS
jgi:hypothetical protein